MFKKTTAALFTTVFVVTCVNASETTAKKEKLLDRVCEYNQQMIQQIQQTVAAQCKSLTTNKGDCEKIDKHTDLTKKLYCELVEKVRILYKEKFTEAELEELVTWLESETNRKVLQLLPELMSSMQQSVVKYTQELQQLQ